MLPLPLHIGVQPLELSLKIRDLGSMCSVRSHTLEIFSKISLFPSAKLPAMPRSPPIPEPVLNAPDVRHRSWLAQNWAHGWKQKLVSARFAGVDRLLRQRKEWGNGSKRGILPSRHDRLLMPNLKLPQPAVIPFPSRGKRLANSHLLIRPH